MALLSKADAGRKDGGYSRVLGDDDLGALISQIHATSISAGTELEKIIARTKGEMTFSQLTQFLNGSLPNGTYLMSKKLIKKHLKKVINSTTEPDFVVFVIVDANIYAVELKDGDQFDTKKASGEVSKIRQFANDLHSYLIKGGLSYQVNVRFCCFNQTSKDKIVAGLKNQIKKNEALTGDEFCKMLNISYATILSQRAVDADKNFNYFTEKLLGISSVRKTIIEKLASMEFPEDDVKCEEECISDLNTESHQEEQEVEDNSSTSRPNTPPTNSASKMDLIIRGSKDEDGNSIYKE